MIGLLIISLFTFCISRYQSYFYYSRMPRSDTVILDGKYLDDDIDADYAELSREIT